MPGIILASQSPRRKQLLEWTEIEFDIIVKPTEESYPKNLSPSDVAIHIAREKALVVKQKINQGTQGRHIGEARLPILAADTIVVLGNEIIGKPENRQHAIDILSKLSGNHHKVITGVIILHGDKEVGFSDTTDVLFYELAASHLHLLYLRRFALLFRNEKSQLLLQV